MYDPSDPVSVALTILRTRFTLNRFMFKLSNIDRPPQSGVHFSTRNKTSGWTAQNKLPKSIARIKTQLSHN